jgi:hypothetical protein
VAYNDDQIADGEFEGRLIFGGRSIQDSAQVLRRFLLRPNRTVLVFDYLPTFNVDQYFPRPITYDTDEDEEPVPKRTRNRYRKVVGELATVLKAWRNDAPSTDLHISLWLADDLLSDLSTIDKIVRALSGIFKELEDVVCYLEETKEW